MRLKFRYVTLLLVFFLSVLQTDINAQYVEFETSWKKAKKKSKRSGKPILAIFSHSKYNDINERYFGVDSIARSLKEDFVLYSHIKGNKTPWYISRFSTVIISDYKENKYKDIWYYYFKDNLLEEIRSYDKPQPLSYYEEKYEEDKNSLSFLKEYVEYALKYRLQKTKVFYDYFRRINGFNCLKVQCVTQHLYHTLPTEELLSYYEEMTSLECDNDDIENRIFFSYHRDFLYQHGREPIASRYSDYHEAAIKTTAFLGETDRYRDSLIDYNSWRYHSKQKDHGYIKEEGRIANTLLLKALKYDLENIYTQDSLQSMLFDLSVTIDNRKELYKLVEIIKEKPIFVNDAAVLEILAIAYIRLSENENAAKAIARANDIAVRNKVRFRTVIPEMKEKGLLNKVDN